MTFAALRAWVGLAGLPEDDYPPRTRYLALFYEWITLLIAIWLPIQWYLQSHKILISPVSLIIDWLIWAIFLSETVTLFVLVRKRFYYLCTNWMNLLIIVFLFPYLWMKYPLFGSLRVLRVLVTLFIAAPWVGMGHRFLERNRVWTTLIVFLVVVLLGGLIITTFNSGIQNPLQGLWWAFETVTTVGYGDVVPTTWTGKLFAVFVMCLGFVIFSLLTAHISSYFIGKRSMKEQDTNREIILDHIRETQKQIEGLTDRVHRLHAKLDEMSKPGDS